MSELHDQVCKALRLAEELIFRDQRNGGVMNVGDHVRVFEGEKKGMTGEVILVKTEIVNERVSVKLDDDTVIHVRGSELSLVPK